MAVRPKSARVLGAIRLRIEEIRWWWGGRIAGRWRVGPDVGRGL